MVFGQGRMCRTNWKNIGRRRGSKKGVAPGGLAFKNLGRLSSQAARGNSGRGKVWRKEKSLRKGGAKAGKPVSSKRRKGQMDTFRKNSIQTR